jgi:hypothetical protein
MSDIEEHHGQKMIRTPDGRLVYFSVLLGGRGRINAGDETSVQAFW